MIPKKVKIVATTGPSVESKEKILHLAELGVNVFRINMSHASLEEAEVRTKWVRLVEKEIGRPLTVMVDLAGPKIRIGDVAEATVLKENENIEVVEKEVLGDHRQISLNYASVVTQLQPGAEIYIDDGKIKLLVEKKTGNGVLARIIAGGLMKPRKGFYGQGISLAARGLSQRDKDSIDLAVKIKADSLAISFVQSKEDIQIVRKRLPQDSEIKLVTKLETFKGIENVESIIEETDILMLARGDLGLAVPMEEIPHLQKQLIELCRRKAKPVITATQMLESMIENPIPTRAEVTDVANAILDGTDAVMLSAETSAGLFPFEAVKMMARIIKRAVPHAPQSDIVEDGVSNAVTEMAGKLARRLGAKLVIVFTETGSTARRISRQRHQEAIIALSPNLNTVRFLNFSYNVYSQLIRPVKSFDDMKELAKKAALSNKIVPLEKGDPFVIVAGMPFRETGSTNMIHVERA